MTLPCTAPFARALRVAAAVALFATTTAQATDFNVSPVSVSLTETASSAMVVITNNSQTPARLQVSLFAWQQLPNGEMELKPTQDVLFFPAMLVLGPREARNIRVGTRLKPSGVERTYRLFVQELPSPVSSTTGSNTIRMLAKMGLPVFLTPGGARARPQIGAVALQGAKASFRVQNAGNAHMRVDKLVLRARSASGEVWKKELDGWYVLAGGIRDYEVEVPAQACAATTTLEVELMSQSGPAKASAAVRCGG